MKKNIIVAIALLISVALACTAAFAQGGGPQGSNSGSGGGQTPNQGEMQPMQYGLGDPIFINVNAIEDAINQVQDREMKTQLLRLLQQYQICTSGESLAQEQAALNELRNALQAAGVEVPGGGPMNYSYTYGRECGRFLDADKVADAIALVTDEETAAGLTALLEAYEEALDANAAAAVAETLEALMSGLADAQLQVDEYTGLQLYMATQGLYLDTIAVEAAIVALENPDTVSQLLSLLDTYMMAANGGGLTAAQDALTALISALEAAGIQI
ncbi:MAG: hypothetical protein JW811_08185 [Clostridiales bacterium]|nr:hypothetical protein [Clostridiales bacterium]